MSVREEDIPKPEPLITVSTNIGEGLGCLMGAGAFAIVLWALLTFGVPLAKYVTGAGR